MTIDSKRFGGWVSRPRPHSRTSRTPAESNTALVRCSHAKMPKMEEPAQGSFLLGSPVPVDVSARSSSSFAQYRSPVVRCRVEWLGY